MFSKDKNKKKAIITDKLSNDLLWAVSPAAPPVVKRFIATFGAADAVITVVHTRLTVW